MRQEKFTVGGKNVKHSLHIHKHTCVCVCVYIYMCVCVCVCIKESQLWPEFIDLLPTGTSHAK